LDFEEILLQFVHRLSRPAGLMKLTLLSISHLSLEELMDMPQIKLMNSPLTTSKSKVYLTDTLNDNIYLRRPHISGSNKKASHLRQ